jgi:hypothetical protein
MGLLGQARGPLPQATAELFLASPAWAGLSARLTSAEAASRDDALLYAAMLMPAVVMPRLLLAIDPLHSASAREVRAYAELVLAIPLNPDA